MANSRLERIGTIMSRVEGLIKHGGIKPEDRPIWLDIYKAFPPITEPKFARPKSEHQPIRPILYQEDVARADFHSKGYGTGAVNLTSAGDTQTMGLLQRYEKMISEGVPHVEAIEKSAELLEVMKQEYLASSSAKVVAKNPESVTSKVLAEADLKNIFKEKED